MNKKFFALLSVFLVTISIFLVSFTPNEPKEFCATDEVLEMTLKNDTSILKRYLRSTKEIPNLHRYTKNTNEDLVIPVVFHIMHKGEPYGVESNVSDDVILQALESLNADFAGNPYFETTNDNPLYPQTDSHIKFCLAQTDPDGNPTNGINRVYVDIPEYIEDGVDFLHFNDPNYHEEVKEYSAWSSNDYCNIWIVDMSSPLGFADIPIDDTPTYLDGIVVAWDNFGIVDYNVNWGENNTLTHEMGHFLGLYHTFHNTDDCGDEPNCESYGDYICDTPPTTGTFYNCEPDDCEDTMVENYMDYGNDPCSDRFSPQQIQRMRDVLLNDSGNGPSRNYLLNNRKCLSVEGLNLMVDSLVFTEQIECCSEINGYFKLINTNQTTVNDAVIQVSVDGNTPYTFQWNGELLKDEYEYIELPTIDMGYGTHDVSINIASVNSFSDLYEFDNTTTSQYNRIDGQEHELKIRMDALPYGFTYELYNLSQEQVVVEYEYLTVELMDSLCTEYSYEFCLPQGDYQLTIQDVIYGNGQSNNCPNFPEGYGFVELLQDNQSIFYEYGNWGDEVVYNFTISNTTGCNDFSCLDDNNNGICDDDEINTVDVIEPIIEFNYNFYNLEDIRGVREVIYYNYLGQEITKPSRDYTSLIIAVLWFENNTKKVLKFTYQ